MKINLDELDNETQEKYEEFEREVKDLAKKYIETDPKRFEEIQKMIEQKGKDWDADLELLSHGESKHVDLSSLLAYEYWLSAEIVTNGKVSFEAMMDKLFDGVERFRIGNPVPGKDDKWLYGKSFNDETAMPVTSKNYRLATKAGAQHINGIKDGKYVSAVFVFEEGFLPDFYEDEEGRKIAKQTDGINFSNLRHGQSLLTNLRQTVFHEWNHNAEKEIIDPSESELPYEYTGVDGKKYRNYERIDEYVELNINQSIEEADLILTSERNRNGERIAKYRNEDGTLTNWGDKRFELDRKQLDESLCISTGVVTKEIGPNGEMRIQNGITEGFVEMISREMVRAIDPDVKDIAIDRYFERVQMAEKVSEARDASFGDEGKGATIADFLMHSGSLKNELEGKVVTKDDGSRVDGLHYITDYLNDLEHFRTPKGKALGKMPEHTRIIGLSEKQVREIEKLPLWAKSKLVDEEKEKLAKMLTGGNEEYLGLTKDIVESYLKALDKEREFFEGVGEKLGYTERKIDDKDVSYNDTPSSHDNTQVSRDDDEMTI